MKRPKKGSSRGAKAPKRRGAPRHQKARPKRPSRVEQKYDSKFFRLRKRLTELGVDLDSLNAKVSAIEAQVSGVNGALDAAVERARAELADATARLDGKMTDQSSEMRARSEGSDQKLASFDQSFSRQVAELQERAASLERSLPQGIAALEEKISASDARGRADLEKVDQRVGSLSDGLGGAGQKLAGLEAALSALNGKVDGVMADLSSSLARATERLDAVEAKHRAQMEELSHDLRSVEKTMKADLGNDADRLNSLGKKVDEIDASVKARTEKVQSELTDLRGELRDALRSVLRASVGTNPP